MKALLTSGLGLALGLLTLRLGAGELEWRSSKPKAAPASAAPLHVAPVRAAVGLGRPADGLPAPGCPTDASTGRAVMLGKVRAKDDAEDPRPLPPGPLLTGDPKAKDEPKKDSKSEYIPTPPTPLTGPEGSGDACGDACECCPCDCGPFRGWLRGWWASCCATWASCYNNLCDDCGPFHTGPFGGGLFGCGDCCESNRPCWWVNGSYLLWTVSGQQTPPLVTVNPNPGLGGAPFIGNPGTTVVLGGDDIENDVRSGASFQGGYWFRRYPCWGVDGSFFYLGNQAETFVLSSNGVPQIGRPFINADTGLPFAELVAGTNQNGANVSGSIVVDHTFQMWGADFHLRRKTCDTECGWCDFFVGFRHINLNEELSIIETPRTTSTAAPVTQFIVSDRFGTQNMFNGIDLGFQGERRFGRRWFVQGTARVALGDIQQIVDIMGTTTRIIGAGPPETVGGGFAALSSNIGKHTRNTFGVVPEVGIKVGFDVTERLRLYAGYDLMWINSVVRPGEQVDPVINLGLVPFRGAPNTGQARPAVLFRTSDFWAQGAKFGLEYRY